MPSDQIVVPAPAKINRCLHVVGQRQDGYHLLESVFTFLDWADDIGIELRQDGQIKLLKWLDGVAPEDDLTVRAARLLQEYTQCKMGCNLSITKRLPMGGGLGGGSSDAASVLIGLNKLWQANLGRNELMQLGLKLGADVPVFIFGQSAFAQGIGEELSAFAQQEYGYLILVPMQSSYTPAIFSQKDLTRNTASRNITFFLNQEKNFAENGGKYSVEYANNLQNVVLSLYPDLARFIQELNDIVLNSASQALFLDLQPAIWQIANGDQVQDTVWRMTGSGSCFFMQFTTVAQARQAQELLQAIVSKSTKLLSQWSNMVRMLHACKGISQHTLYNWFK